MASSPQHEPTMEEILASIRKIISEDSSEPPKPAAAPQPQMEAEVLELTQEVHDEPVPVMMEEPTPAPAPVPAPMEAAAPQPDVVFQPIHQESAMSSSARADMPNDDIFSDKTRQAIDDAFDQIDDTAASQPAAAPRARPAASFSSSTTDGDSVEAVFERAVTNAIGPHIEQWMDGRKDEILSSLRPVIREWMDDHFPALLEGAVRDEVARAIKARGR